MSTNPAQGQAGSQQRAMMEFERAVYARDYAQAVTHLRAVLQATENGADAGFSTRATSLRGHTRFAAAVTALMADPDFGLDYPAYLNLSVVRCNLALLFAASGFGDGRHLAHLAGARRPQGRQSHANPAALRKMLIGLDLASGPATIATVLEKFEPAQTIPVILGLLRHRQVFTAAEEASRTYLLSRAPAALDAGELTGPWLRASAGPWFLCSYASAPRKHELKAALNRAYRRHFASTGITDRPLPAPRPRAERPVLLVIGEHFRTGHAMYRCYAARLAQAARRFRTVLMARSDDVDEAAAAQFDALIAAGNDIRANVCEIDRLAPDVIFYPSVGMRSWSVLLANLRLAPIQLMSVGHPASSFSNVMDYLLLGRDVASEAAEISERVVVLDYPRAHFVPHRDDPHLAPITREQPTPLRIAVPARSMKLGAAFITACRRISLEAGRPIEFHFFPNRQGAYFRAVENALLTLLPGVTVYPSTDYATYMRRLNECDIALSPFPFGSGNSAVDAVLQAVPMVAFEGVEPHARTGLHVLRVAGLPDWLLARDEESYVTAALRLARDEAERVALSHSLRGTRERLFTTDPEDQPGTFVDALTWIYENHEVIQTHPSRFWWPEDRDMFAAKIAGAAR